MLRETGWHRGALRQAGGLFALAVALCGASAMAEAAADSLAPNGIKIGEGRLHPYLDIEGRIDSQAVVNPNPGAGGPVYLPDLIANFRGGLRFDLSTPSTALNFNGNAGLSWYTGAISGVFSPKNAQFTTDVGIAGAFNRDGALEVQIGDQLYRDSKGTSPDVTVGIMSLRNAAYLAAPIHPGGKGIEVTPKVNWAVEFFEPRTGCTSADPNCTTVLRELNSNDLNFGINAKWRFLPKTAVVIDLDFGWRSYWNSPNPPPLGTPAGPGFGHPNSYLLKGMAGLSGLITSKLALVLMVGGGGDFWSKSATLLVTGELSWTPIENLRMRLGYVRTLQPVASTGIYGDDRPYLSANATFFHRLGLSLTGSLDWLTFYGVPNAQGLVVDRSDYLVSVDFSPSVIITSWFNVSASYILSIRGNAFVNTANGATLPAGYTPYTRHEGVLRLTFQY